MTNKAIFIPLALILAIAVIYGLVDPTGYGKGAEVALNWTLNNFNWFYALGATLLLIFCLWAGFSKYGNIKLGGRDAKPELSKFNWWAISFCAGMGLGLTFYGVAEPMNHYINPPLFLGAEPGSAKAAETALRYTFFHWTFHTYGIYVAAGICIGFFFYNCKKPFKVSSSLFPIIGEKISGRLGTLVDALAIFAISGGIASSLGLGAMQIGGGLNFLWDIPTSNLLWFVIILICTFCFTLSSYTGLQKGIKLLSRTNAFLFIALVAFVLFLGPTVGILRQTITALGDYIINLIPMALYVDPIINCGWTNTWTIYYWAFWLAYAPIMGLFLVRCAKGRTIKEFVIVNMIAPAAFCILWFGVFGSAAIQLEHFTDAGIWELITTGGIEVALFALFKELPLYQISSVFGIICATISFISLSDSMTSTIASMITLGFGDTKEETEPPAPMKIFWGSLLGLLAFVILLSGGISAIQSTVIICGLPILILLLFMVYSYIKAMYNLKEYDLINPQEAEVLSKVPEYHVPNY